jgi:hypothetical protein
MGQGTAETVTEIEQTRARLDTELRQLEARIPAAAVWAKRAVGAAIGGGIGAVVLRSVLRRRRKHEPDRRLRGLERRLDRLERELGA